MIVHELTPMGPFFLAGGAVGTAITGALMAVRRRHGRTALVVASLGFAVLLPLLARELLGATDFVSDLKGTLWILLPIAALAEWTGPGATLGRFAGVSFAGGVVFVFMMFGGGTFLLTLALLVGAVLAVRRLARRRGVRA